ncbi:MAG: DUF72 domain-containing protein [Candidatus Hydrothermarchaeota archaeon]
MKKYFETFKLVEVQKTFYKIPRLETLKKWRKQSPRDFEFTIKASQLITHSPKSPTYKKGGIEISKESINKYGYFRPTEENFNAWEETKNACKALDAKIVVFQSPPKFKESEEHISNIVEFFECIDRGTLNLVWEPRGDWNDDTIKKLCEKLDLVHCTDPFAKKTLYSKDFVYFRLHGSPPGEKMYYYRYSKEDLNKLKEICASIDVPQLYCLFNNVHMFESAKEFLEMMS